MCGESPPSLGVNDLAPKNSIYILLGTGKGAFILSSNSKRRNWKLKGPFFENCPVFHLAFDSRDDRTIYAAVNSYHFGPTIYRTKNFGAKWKHAKGPPRFAKGSGLKVENIWHVEPGYKDDNGVVYAGVAPGALFRSVDEGENFEMNQGLNNHPTRAKWQPGAGGLCLHSVIVDPSNKKRIFGISALGVFKSEDSGETWSRKTIMSEPTSYHQNIPSSHSASINSLWSPRIQRTFTNRIIAEYTDLKTQRRVGLI